MQRYVQFIVVVLAVAATSAFTEEVQSSINSAATEWTNPLRFFGLTKTLATTTTVVSMTTVYVHPTCTVVAAGTPACSAAPPTTTPAPTTTPTPTTTTTPTPTTPTTTPTTTSTAPTTTTSAKPFFQLIPGGTSPLISGSVTINKVNPPKVQINMPTMSGSAGSGSAGGLGNLFNKPPVNLNMAAGVSAVLSAGSATAGRRRRSKSLEEPIEPSIVRAMEITASPDLPMSYHHAEPEQLLEGSRQNHDEFELIGLTSPQMVNRAFPQLVTIVKLARVTVTVASTVTTAYPVAGPTDRVTLSIAGCVPTDLPKAAMNPC